jgi:Protein of unknown function (DUF3467).
MEVSIEVLKSDEFRQIYAVGAMGGHSPYDFRISFYNDTPRTLAQKETQVNVMERKIETEIILPPLAAKELAEWLSTHVKEFEKQFGEIKKPGRTTELEQTAPLKGYM